MRTDWIEEVGIDQDGGLWVRPATASFPYIYREAMEVRWDAERRRLYSPKPREWSYVAWFTQIICGAHYQGVDLEIGQTTRWSDIAPDLQQAIKDSSGVPPCTDIGFSVGMSDKAEAVQ